MTLHTVRTGFTAAEHGFKFWNSFEFSASLSLKPITRRPVDLGTVVLGLCGGMCFAALDYFHAHKPIPAVADPKAIKTELRNYLVDRQLDSLARGAVVKVLDWTAREDSSLAVSVSGWEAPKLRKQLDDTVEPAVLALIRVGGVTHLMENHQVVATGYDFDDVTNEMVVYLYDPNWPGDTPKLRMTLTKPSAGIALVQSTDEPVRGFFVIGYGRQTPPNIT
jgi:hypothetical protein